MRLTLHNVQKVYTYPLVQLCGSIQCFNDHLRRPCQVKVICSSDCSVSKLPIIWPIVGDHFKILVHLSEPVNRYKLWIEDEEQIRGKVVDSVDICLRFEATVGSEKDDRIRLVYVTCKDAQHSSRLFGDGQFEAPEEEDCSVESACRRISLGALMSQCFFAKSTKRTYQLEFTSSGWPLVHQFTIDRNQHELWRLTSEELWKLVASELMNSSLANRNCKYLAFISFSRYRANPEQPQWLPSSQVRGYVSLGGGGLALLSTHCLYTWPETPDDIPLCLTDDRPVDRKQFMDDSHNRNTRSGCYATTLGASIHELAHTFNLGHSESGIMERQFNQIDHFFLPLSPEPTSWWTVSELAILQHHRWLNHRAIAQSTSTSSSHFTFDHQSQVIHSHHPLIVAEYRRPATNEVLHRTVCPTKNPTRRFEVKTTTFCDSTIHQECLLFLMDCKGNILLERIGNSQQFSN